MNFAPSMNDSVGIGNEGGVESSATFRDDSTGPETADETKFSTEENEKTDDYKVDSVHEPEATVMQPGEELVEGMGETPPGADSEPNEDNQTDENEPDVEVNLHQFNDDWMGYMTDVFNKFEYMYADIIGKGDSLVFGCKTMFNTKFTGKLYNELSESGSLVLVSAMVYDLTRKTLRSLEWSEDEINFWITEISTIVLLQKFYNVIPNTHDAREIVTIILNRTNTRIHENIPTINISNDDMNQNAKRVDNIIIPRISEMYTGEFKTSATIEAAAQSYATYHHSLNKSSYESATLLL